MSWHSIYPFFGSVSDNYVAPEVERMAQRLATQAGADWASMSNYPGFERNRWREHAEQILKAAT